MSKAGDLLREQIRKFEECLPELSDDERAESLKIIKELRRCAVEADTLPTLPPEPTPEELEWEEFAHRLATRQGTFTPDFDTLAERKAELDRRLFGE